ncbi:hypothetical protein C9374_013931 [Naegleria lovaniensis]|uniref:DUF423 domain-containing protein n=1 Tax=Naegleria lovaniensis TaxID=51637 RepID=A0AA88GVU4_NAELO|nr:uncharacterized protein C9374_013931 [Naegleria lovaniensis]KAG2389371.1 hypothetical protein C9374_013931 [Naegleria lovaniensis]
MVWQTLLQHPANFYFRLGALNAAIAVCTGAFGGHGLKRFATPEKIDVWKTAVQYHLIHSLALLAVSQLKTRHHLVGGLFTAGIVLFSGSLYALVLTDHKKLGAITPIGGFSFIFGWLAMAAIGL